MSVASLGLWQSHTRDDAIMIKFVLANNKSYHVSITISWNVTSLHSFWCTWPPLEVNEHTCLFYVPANFDKITWKHKKTFIATSTHATSQRFQGCQNCEEFWDQVPCHLSLMVLSRATTEDGMFGCHSGPRHSRVLCTCPLQPCQYLQKLCPYILLIISIPTHTTPPTQPSNIVN